MFSIVLNYLFFFHWILLQADKKYNHYFLMYVLYIIEKALPN